MKPPPGIFLIMFAILGMALITACTDNSRARQWGGTMTRTLPEGQKLVGVTWKESNLWILTRPRRQGETAETHTLQEDSTFGVLSGTVTIVER